MGQPAVPPPVVKQSNGIALAAMIVGIAAVVLCFTFVPGVVALILGVIGLGKAKGVGGKGKGQAITGIVLGLLSVVLGIGSWWAIARGADRVEEVVDELAGPADPSTYEVSVTRCQLDDVGNVVAQGRLENTSDEERNYEVRVEFVRGGDVLDSGNTFLTNIAADDSVVWEITGIVDGDGNLRCTVTDVNNLFN